MKRKTKVTRMTDAAAGALGKPLSNEKKGRDARFELMRVACMLLIVTSHSMTHSQLIGSLEPFSRNYIIAWIVRCLCRVSVSGFVMVNGYFMYEKQLHLKKILLLLYEVLTYSVLIYVIFCLLHLQEFSAVDFVRFLFPVATKRYWFVTCYVLLLLFTPALNPATGKMTRKQHLALILVLTYIFGVAAPLMQWSGDFSQVDGGDSVLFFMYLYLVAAYLHKYPRREVSGAWWKYGLGYLGTMVLVAAITLLLKMMKSYIDSNLYLTEFFYNRNSILSIIGALCFFKLFQNIREIGPRASKLICSLSGMIFAVYLIHDNSLIRPMLWTTWTHITAFGNRLMLWPYMLACVACVFTACIAVEYIRKSLSKALGIDRGLARLCGRLESAFYAAIDKRLE